MPRLLILLLICLAVSWSGCSPGASTGPTFATGDAAYAPGDPVPVTLRNTTDREQGYNICFAFLELERKDDAWTVVSADLGPSPDSACTAQLNLMAPGEEDADTAYLPAEVEAGTYRLAATVEVDGVRQRLVTDAFAVR